MGIFDLFKKSKLTHQSKPQSEKTTQKSSSPTDAYSQKPSVIKTENEQYYKLGQGIGVTTSFQASVTEYEYNEVLAYAQFFNTYKSIKAPKYFHESEYIHWQFLRAGVKDVHILHIELFEKGYYQPANTQEILSIYKVPEIKQIATTLGIAVSGKKNDIINAIASKSSAIEVSKILNTEFFSLSDKAFQYLKDHEIDIEYYNRDDNDMSLEQYKAKRQKVSKEEIEWADLEKDLKADKDGFGRNPYLNIAYFYASHQKCPEALLAYLKVLYIDLSGVDSYRAWTLERGSDKESVDFRVERAATICIAPGLINDIKELIDKYYAPSMIDEVCKLNLPIQACSRKMFEEIIGLIQKGVMEQEVCKKIEAVLNKNLRVMAKEFSNI